MVVGRRSFPIGARLLFRWKLAVKLQEDIYSCGFFITSPKSNVATKLLFGVNRMWPLKKKVSAGGFWDGGSCDLCSTLRGKFVYQRKIHKNGIVFIRNVNSLRFVYFISYQKEHMIELVVIDMKHYQYHACFWESHIDSSLWRRGMDFVHSIHQSDKLIRHGKNPLTFRCTGCP